MTEKILLRLAAVACMICPTLSWAQTVDFQTQIKPLLSDRCFRCHGPDKENREADLRLDRKEALLQESQLEDRAILAPGKPADSEMFLRITSEDDDLRMPPADSKFQLSKDEVELIRRWIEQGAAWEEHWAFQSPTSHKPPQGSDDAWSRNEIDRFVLSRMKSGGFTPAATADRRTLIRRVTFDLTGLPPTPADIQAFLNDNSPDAYEKLVDRLLKSDDYGIRMASMWLDAARYSDTYGYQVDRDRFVWPWRDWVVDAFNRNLSYADFATLQLAGDQLGDKTTRDTKLATTFCRLHPQKVEGGSVEEEFRIEYVADRTETFATAFLGLTLGCARCHDHKYDPLSQKEYYQLTAFFDKIDESGLYSYFTSSIPTPTLALNDEATDLRLKQLAAEVAKVEQRLSEQEARNDNATFEQWLTSPERLKLAEQPLAGQLAHLTFEDKKVGRNSSVPGKQGLGAKLTGDDAIGVGVGNFKRFEPFSVGLWMNVPDHKERAVIFHRSRAWTDAGSRGYQVLLEDGKLSASLIHFWPGNAIRIRTKHALPLETWQHVTVTYDGSSRAKGLQIYLNGKAAETVVVRDLLYKNITGGGGDKIAIGERFRDRGFRDGLVDEFRVFDRELNELECAELAGDTTRKRILATATNELLQEDRVRLRRFFEQTLDKDALALRSQLKQHRTQLCQAQDRQREIMVMSQMAQPRDTFVLNRGVYSERAEKVSATTPVSISNENTVTGQDRLALAKWLTAPQHPLTSRVAVNRFWQLIFGVGIVRTPEDFGSQGQPPTHPLLLDWLANDFSGHGWDVKRLVKQMVMSATYRQAAVATRETIARDPENRFLARANSYRLPAEMLRDAALSSAGLLVKKLGGAPVKPYDLELSFKPTKRDRGEGLYRRSLYTYWKRTGPAPMMMALDAAKRDVCRVKRERTSSPLQAFIFMNGAQFVEASRVLATKQLQENKGDANAAILAAFEILLGRPPRSAETDILRRAIGEQIEYFQADKKRVDQLLAVGDAVVPKDAQRATLAACTVVVNMLMSHDECVTRR